MIVKVHLNKLLLKQKFTISHGSYSHRDQLLIELRENNLSGFGETIAIDYYDINIETLEKEARRIIPEVNAFDISKGHQEFYEFLLQRLPTNAFLRAAFDCAYIDLKSKLDNKSIRQYLQIPENPEIASSITIGLSDTVESIDKMINEPWPFYKIKVNTEDFREEVMQKVHKSGKQFGIDANGSLSISEAEKMLMAVDKYKGIYVEQLTAKDQDIRLRNGKIPHLADEAITDLNSANELLTIYDGFVLKLTKCGGITPILKIIKLAKNHNKKLLAGCMTESSIGINHMIQLLPYFDYADLDGAYLISNDNDVRDLDVLKKRLLQSDGFFH